MQIEVEYKSIILKKLKNPPPPSPLPIIPIPLKRKDPNRKPICLPHLMKHNEDDKFLRIESTTDKKFNWISVEESDTQEDEEISLDLDINQKVSISKSGSRDHSSTSGSTGSYDKFSDGSCTNSVPRR